ncbi:MULTISPECIES: hypothetical protein [Cyclobacteriaceae]|jgi:hypothetical protein|uniref:Uncharacterized protein n=1 Tax=Aquiflexum gelatinilyticum TaxID=2961943 RepID=A0A9X2T078_9BACT|nr:MULTISPECIES: hypothetical protein [Cyclobacteriaceae]MCR9017359.1 hypothetical protein [Aquiflexum gelatinilyticum]
MKTIQVKVSEKDLEKYNLDSDPIIDFKLLVEKINLDFARKALEECQNIAKEVGLAELTLEEIDAEIKAVRNESHS